MSIINEALKKARREAGAKEKLSEAEEAESVIRPKTRIGSKSKVKTVLPGFALLILFFLLVGGLAFFVYQEYFAETESAPATVAESSPPPPAPVTAQEEASASADQGPATETVPAPPINADPPTDQRPERGLTPTQESAALAPAPAVEAAIPVPRPAPAPPPKPTNAEPSMANAEIMSQLKINGVMRKGSSPRVLTNSGVYRIGDAVTAPAGYVVEEIGEERLILRSPDGNQYYLPLP